MSAYQGSVSGVLDALKTKLQGLSSGGNAIFQTTSLAEPFQFSAALLPAAYILLGQDRIKQQAQFLDYHALDVSIYINHFIQGTGDTEAGFRSLLSLAGAVHDALVEDRTLGGMVGRITVKNIEYGRAINDAGIVFWAKVNIESDLRYSAGKPVAVSLIQTVQTKAEEVN